MNEHFPGTTCILFVVYFLLFLGCREEPAGDGTLRPEMTRSELIAAGSQPPIFREVTESAGIDFIHQPGPFGNYFLPQIMGGGAAMFDYDTDGDLDIFLVNGTFRSDAGGTAAGEKFAAQKSATNRLFRQEADGRFVDVTKGSGLEDPGVFGMGIAVGDVNNDGLPDVYLTNYGPDRLFLNTTEGVFVDVTKEAGIDNRRWSTAAIFFDYDRDGWLDLFVANFLDYDPGRACIESQGKPDFCGPSRFPRTPDILYRNLGGDGECHSRACFADVSGVSGIGGKMGAGLGVVCADFNRDSRPDIYVANDSHANFLWINQEDGTFSDEAILAGVALDRVGRGQASMGLAMGDINDDQQPDLVITHLAGETNALYLSHEGHYEDGSVKSGISAASFPYTGWGVALLDLDHDGDLDLAVVNGRIARTEDASQSPSESVLGEPNPWAPYFEPNQLLINDGTGAFQLRTSNEDAFLKGREMSRALVAGDIDNDGDIDLLVTNIAGQARLFVNDAEKSGNWLSVRATDPRHGNRDAYGAWITVQSDGQSWRRYLNPSSSYLSSHDPRAHFGLGNVDAIDQIEVVWPDGLTERFHGGPVNEFRVVSRGTGESP
ncbi:MAG: CRTAC1 family protein [Planctomycetota bacterium]|nr:CRTAC1 family protein [Planctomycetota bacterium]